MRTRFTSCIVVTLLLALIGGAAFALQPVTYVSSAGVDTAAGTRTAPNATIEAAIVNTSDGGEVYVLDPGVYLKDNKTLFITKNITIDGGAGRMGHIRGTVVISLGGNKVTLRNLAFSGSGDGIDEENGGNPNLVVDNCTFACAQYGITAQTTNVHVNVTVTNSTFTGGQRAVWIVGISPFTQFTLQNDNITGTSGAAIFVESLGADINKCLIANCFEGVTVDNGGFATVENCNLTHDNTGVIVNTGSALSLNNDNFQYCGTAMDAIGFGNLISAGNNKLNFNTSNGSAPGFTTTVE